MIAFITRFADGRGPGVMWAELMSTHLDMEFNPEEVFDPPGKSARCAIEKTSSIVERSQQTFN